MLELSSRCGVVAVDGPGTRCQLPGWVAAHHTWSSLDTAIRLHVNSGERSFKLRNLQDPLHPEDSHVTCHGVVSARADTARVVTYVKSGCDSGFMCAEFSRETDNVMRVQFGHKARIPGEACSALYFSPPVIKSLLLVSSRTAPAPACPLSGRYTISSARQLPVPWAQCGPGLGHPTQLSLSSGCGSSALTLEHSCQAGAGAGSLVTRTEYRCHASWAGPGPRTTNVIISSSGAASAASVPGFLCLSYTDSQGLVSSHDCPAPGGHAPHHAAAAHSAFNLSLSGPCVQALSASAVSAASWAARAGSLLSLLPLLSLL